MHEDAPEEDGRALMACRVLQVGDAVAIVCGRGPRPKSCSVCRKHVADKLCDGIIAPPVSAAFRRRTRTCDVPLCACCAVTRPDPKKKNDTLDYCSRCVKNAPPEQLALTTHR